MKIRILKIFLASFVFVASPLRAKDNFFYDGTRARSMGRAFLGVSDDESAVFYNPAGLTQIVEQRVSCSGIYQQYEWQSTLYEEVFFTCFEQELSLSYVRHGIGILFSTASRGWQEEVMVCCDTPPMIPCHRVEPVFDERTLAVSYAHAVHRTLSIGATGKYVNTANSYEEVCETYKIEKHGFALDIGVLFQPLEMLSCGLTVNNTVSSKIDYTISDDIGAYGFFDKLPVSVNIGLAFQHLDVLVLAADVRNLFEDDVPFAGQEIDYTFKRSYHVGCEWRIIPALRVRAGYFNTRRPSIFSGVQGQDLEYDSYNNYTFGLGFRHRFIAVDFGLKGDNRTSKIEDLPIRVKDSTLSWTASVSIIF